MVPSQYDSFRVVGKSVHLVHLDNSGYLSYLHFDKHSWSKPIRIEQSRRRRGVVRSRLAVDGDGVVHIAWWNSGPGAKPAHGYAVIRRGAMEVTPLILKDVSIHEDTFDLGVSPDQGVMIAYRPALAAGQIDAETIHVVRRNKDSWSRPEKISGSHGRLSGDVKIVWTRGQAMVTWLAGAERLISVTDGKGWSRPRIMAKVALERHLLPGRTISISLCLDKHGNVHAAWGNTAPLYCLLTRLRK
jgi:hypothetical protein